MRVPPLFAGQAPGTADARDHRIQERGRSVVFPCKPAAGSGGSAFRRCVHVFLRARCSAFRGRNSRSSDGGSGKA